VTQLANALGENNINVNKITGICITISSCKISEKVCGLPRLIENTTRELGQRYAYKDWQRQAVNKIAIRRQSRPTNPILGLSSGYRQARQRPLRSLENQLVISAEIAAPLAQIAVHTADKNVATTPHARLKTLRSAATA
jgi:hypothetical protein